MNDLFPLPYKRYGLIPESLKSYFQNKFCGEPYGHQGNIKDGKTDCFVRIGIKGTNQNLLQAISEVFDFTDYTELVDKILENFRFIDFMSLNLYKYFIPDTIMFEDINEFIKWFPDQSQYINKFNLEKLSKLIVSELALVNRPQPSMKYYKHIKREYIFYKAYKNYQKYLKDDDIKKIPEFVLPVIKVMNPELNIIIVDVNDATHFDVTCDEYSLYNPYIILVKQNDIYEPLHHILALKNRKHISKTFFYENNPFITTIVKHCNTKKIENEIINFLLDNTILHLLNYDMRVVALVAKEEDNKLIIYPLKNHINIDMKYKSKLMLFDIFMYNYKENKYTLKEYQAYYNNINKFLNTNYYPKLEPTGNNSAFKVFDIMIPLEGTFEGLNDILNKEGEVVANIVHEDFRSSFIHEEDYRYKLYISLLNEIFKHKNVIDIDFIRHEANPLTYEEKAAYIYEKVKHIIDNVVMKTELNIYKNNTISNDLCSEQPDDKCKELKHCGFIEQNGNKSCKLKIMKRDYVFLIEKCIDYIINRNNPIKYIDFPSDNATYDNNILIYSNNDKILEQTINNIKSKNISFNYDSKTVKELNKVPIVFESAIDFNSEPTLKSIPKNFKLFKLNSLENLVKILQPLQKTEGNIKSIEDIHRFYAINTIVIKHAKKSVLKSDNSNIYIAFKIIGNDTWVFTKIDHRVILRSKDIVSL
jgi:hypothetical protein